MMNPNLFITLPNNEPGGYLLEENGSIISLENYNAGGDEEGLLI